MNQLKASLSHVANFEPLSNPSYITYSRKLTSSDPTSIVKRVFLRLFLLKLPETSSCFNNVLVHIIGVDQNRGIGVIDVVYHLSDLQSTLCTLQC